MPDAEAGLGAASLPDELPECNHPHSSYTLEEPRERGGRCQTMAVPAPESRDDNWQQARLGGQDRSGLAVLSGTTGRSRKSFGRSVGKKGSIVTWAGNSGGTNESGVTRIGSEKESDAPEGR